MPAFYQGQEIGYILRHIIYCALGRQEHLRRTVTQQEIFPIRATVLKNITLLRKAERIKGANKYNNRLRQSRIIVAFVYIVHVKHCLIIAAALGKKFLMLPRRLHFDVVYSALVILYIHIKANTLAVTF